MTAIRKLFALLLCIAMVAALGVTASASGIGVELNGTPLVFDQPPISQNGRTLVPLRVIFEALGASVNYDPATKTVTAVRHNVTVTMQLGSNSLYRNEQRIYLDVPAQSIGGRTMVPARAVAESFGAVVGYVQSTQTVTISFIPVERVTLDFGELTLERGGQGRLTPAIYPANATNRAAQFTSSDRNIATVADDGSIRAVGAGTATITCTVDGVSVYSEVTVIVPVTRISVSTNRNIFEVGEQFNFTVEVFPEDATDKEYKLDVSGASLLQSGAVAVSRSGEITVAATATNGVKGELVVTGIDLEEFARIVLELTNAERAKHGLRALTWDDTLAEAARLHSEDLGKNNMTGHTGSNGSSPTARAERAGWPYGGVGENCHYGRSTPEAAVASWMDSPGHRDNILDSRYTNLGVGVAYFASGSQYSFYWTQKFGIMR